MSQFLFPEAYTSSGKEGHSVGQTRFILLLLFFFLILNITVLAQDAPVDPSVAPPPHAHQVHLKHVLVIGQTKGFEHDSVSDAMAAIYNMGKESGLWDTMLRTDTELVTKKDLGRNTKTLDYYDAIVFANTTSELDLDDSQKKDMMSFIKEEGKGFVGIHAAMDTNYKWPEYGEMIGGWFDRHPWNVVDAPVIIEDPNFPAMRHFSRNLMLRDEMYIAKSWSRDKVNVLMRMDDTKLDYTGKNNIRPDHDFALAWSKMYGKGRVFYSTLGH